MAVKNLSEVELKLNFFRKKNLSVTSLQDKWEQLNYNLPLLTLYSPAF